MHENPRLFTSNDIRSCRNQNQIKMKPKTSTHDNILWMNMNNTNPNCS